MNMVKRFLLLSDALYIISGSLLGPIYALYVEKLGGDILDASGTFAVFMITAGLVVFLLAFWEDKSKHLKKFVIAGYGIALLGSIGYLFITSTTHLFIVQIILGFAVALKDPAYDALFSLSSKRHLALAWGEWEAVDYFGLGFGAMVGGFIASAFGFYILIWCMVLLSFFSFLASLFLLRRKQ